MKAGPQGDSNASPRNPTRCSTRSSAPPPKSRARTRHCSRSGSTTKVRGSSRSGLPRRGRLAGWRPPGPGPPRCTPASGHGFIPVTKWSSGPQTSSTAPPRCPSCSPRPSAGGSRPTPTTARAGSSTGAGMTPGAVRTDPAEVRADFEQWQTAARQTDRARGARTAGTPRRPRRRHRILERLPRFLARSATRLLRDAHARAPDLGPSAAGGFRRATGPRGDAGRRAPPPLGHAAPAAPSGDRAAHARGDRTVARRPSRPHARDRAPQDDAIRPPDRAAALRRLHARARRGSVAVLTAPCARRSGSRIQNPSATSSPRRSWPSPKPTTTSCWSPTRSGARPSGASRSGTGWARRMICTSWTSRPSRPGSGPATRRRTPRRVGPSTRRGRYRAAQGRRTCRARRPRPARSVVRCTSRAPSWSSTAAELPSWTRSARPTRSPFPSSTGSSAPAGDLLGHASVLCREFGIPCVVGIPGVRQRLARATEVLVDGDQGIVHDLSQEPRASRISVDSQRRDPP